MKDILIKEAIYWIEYSFREWSVFSPDQTWAVLIEMWEKQDLSLGRGMKELREFNTRTKVGKEILRIGVGIKLFVLTGDLNDIEEQEKLEGFFYANFK